MCHLVLRDMLGDPRYVILDVVGLECNVYAQSSDGALVANGHKSYIFYVFYSDTKNQQILHQLILIYLKTHF